MTKKSRAKALRRSFVFCVLLFLFQNSIYPQNSSDVQSGQVSENSSGSFLSSSEKNTDSEWNWNSQNVTQNQTATSSFVLFIKMVFALLVVLVLVYFVLRILRHGSKIAKSDDPFLRHVSHLQLASNRSVDVVTLLDHAYLLGISDNSVNLIGQVEDKELVNSMNLYADKNDNTKRPRSFSDILSIFMPNMNQEKNENVYGGISWNTSEYLRRQRERLSEEDKNE
mgnify:CR=1 FL=1